MFKKGQLVYRITHHYNPKIDYAAIVAEDEKPGMATIRCQIILGKKLVRKGNGTLKIVGLSKERLRPFTDKETVMYRLAGEHYIGPATHLSSIRKEPEYKKLRAAQLEKDDVYSKTYSSKKTNAAKTMVASRTTKRST